MIASLSSAGSSAGLRHALGYADEIRRRCLVNKESAHVVARKLGLDAEQTRGAVRLLKARPHLSQERLALVAMRDWGLTDSDIAEIFRRSDRWAAVVRSQADEIRAEEPIPEHLEYLDSGLQKGDPSPAEISDRAKGIRVVHGVRKDATRGAIRVYAWRGDACLFQSIE